jgi:hypothetical protein
MRVLWNPIGLLGATLHLFVIAASVAAGAEPPRPHVGPAEFAVPAMTPQRTDVLPLPVRRRTGDAVLSARGRASGSDGTGVWPMQLPLDPEESLKHIVTPVGFSIELFAAEPDIVKPVCMAWDERGPAVGRRDAGLPEPVAAGQSRRGLHQDLRRHQRGRASGQVHGVRGEPEHPHVDRLLSRRRDRPERHRNAVPERHQRDGRADCGRCDQRLEHGGHARRREQFPVRIGQLDLGHAGLQPLAAGRRWPAASQRRSGWASSASGRTAANWNSSARRTTTPGAGNQRGGADLRQHRQRQSQRLHADSQPVLRTRPRLERRTIGQHRRHVPVPADHRPDPASRSSRRLHVRRGACAVHRAPVPAPVLEPHGFRLRADRQAGRHVPAETPRSRFPLDQPHESDGQRRRMDRADHGRGRPGRERVGTGLVQLHRPAQSDARRVPDGQGERLRDAIARQTPRADLPRGVCGGNQGRPTAVLAGRGFAATNWSRP